MRSRDPRAWMWTEACELLDQAERLHRQYYVPVRSRSKEPTWEPPVDVLETEQELAIIVALPGVVSDQLQVVIDGAVLVVTALRPMPGQASRSAMIRRLEIPYGRFERRIELPAGRFEIGRRDLANGCLTLSLRKLR